MSLVGEIMALKGLSFRDQRRQLDELERRGLLFDSDSVDYDQLVTAVRMTRDVPGAICDIGVRRGASCQVMMLALEESQCRYRDLIGIDPYGHIEYVQGEGRLQRNDYTNHMRNDAMVALYGLAQKVLVNFVFMNMEDTEFFERFADGVPVYAVEKRLVDRYALVHFDGPHSLETTWDEARFFAPRTSTGSVFVFDNVEGYYDHQPIAEWLGSIGWRQVARTPDKASYVRVH